MQTLYPFLHILIEIIYCLTFGAMYRSILCYSSSISSSIFASSISSSVFAEIRVKDASKMENSVDPDQTAPLGAV